MTSIRCDLRSRRECPCCDADHCDQAPMLDLRDTPVIRFTAGQQLFIFLMLAAFGSVIWYGALYSANEAYGKQSKIEQESSVHVARR